MKGGVRYPVGSESFSFSGVSRPSHRPCQSPVSEHRGQLAEVFCWPITDMKKSRNEFQTRIQCVTGSCVCVLLVGAVCWECAVEWIWSAGGIIGENKLLGGVPVASATLSIRNPTFTDWVRARDFALRIWRLQCEPWRGPPSPCDGSGRASVVALAEGAHGCCKVVSPSQDGLHKPCSCVHVLSSVDGLRYVTACVW
jgi:hypothetical protein